MAKKKGKPGKDDGKKKKDKLTTDKVALNLSFPDLSRITYSFTHLNIVILKLLK